MLSPFLATPIIWCPEHLEEDFRRQEIAKMLERAKATRDFLEGILNPDDFSDVLAGQGYDANQLADTWNEGLRFL